MHMPWRPPRAVSCVLARAQQGTRWSRATLLVRTGHVGTGIEGLGFLLGPTSPPTAIGWSHRRTRTEHQCPTHLVQCTAWTAAPTDCPGAARPMRSASPQRQILQGRAKLAMNAAAASPSASPTPSLTPMSGAEMQSGAHGRQSHSQMEAIACLRWTCSAVWGAMCALG